MAGLSIEDPMCMEASLGGISRASLGVVMPVHVQVATSSSIDSSLVTAVKHGANSSLVPAENLGLTVSRLVSYADIVKVSGVQVDSISVPTVSSIPMKKGGMFRFGGEKPWKLADLKAKLQSIWKLSTSWRLISLGKGYFQIMLTSVADKTCVWGMGSLYLKLGILCLQPWVSDFNPAMEKSSNAQVWVRFYDLSWEYWHPKIISDLAKGIGVPLRLDKAIIDSDFGHFARVLVDVDVSSSPPTSLLLERDDCHSSFISVEYENLSAFCSTCSFIGHLSHACKWNKSGNVSSFSICEHSQQDFWQDNWLGVPILEFLGIPEYLASHLNSRVSDSIHDGRWVLDDCFRVHFPDLCFRIDRIAISPITDSLV
ncbi:hypothetical protein LWI28_000133 [Acer negundo]|uniref:DUF4283 domain-containing protein n=1 Tax=Acer negundo TaxID=4023 RepID=A0AAD5NYX3_ACENE|nr:hypothetical protein LWI28_000133 [Acer negundo]